MFSPDSFFIPISILLSSYTYISLATLSPCTTICSHSHRPHSTTCYGGACLQLEESYNMFSVPRSAADEALPVKLAMTLYSVSNIDIDEGSFEVELGLQLNWKDNRMKLCQCEERSNRKTIKLSGQLEDEIWMPDVEVLDVLAVEKEVGLSKHGGIRLVQHEDATGVIYDIRINVVINCNFIATWFPFDSNICLVRLGSDLHPVNHMNVSMDKLPDLTLKPSNGFEYSLEQLEEGQRRFLPFSSYSHGEFQCVGFKLGITRMGNSVMMQYMAIMGMLVIMTILTVILPASMDKLGPIAVLLIGALTVYTTVNTNSPRPTTGLSPLVIYVLMGMSICYVSLLEFFVVLRFRRQNMETWVERLDKIFILVGLLSLVISTVIFWGFGEFADMCEERFGGKEGICYHNVDV